MKVQQLRHLIAVADSVSYAQAAKRCFTSRQNIVHSVREIEGELNATLFERKGNEIVPTAAGRQAARQARSIVSDIDKLRYMFARHASDDAVTSLAVSMNLFAGIPEATTAYFTDRAAAFRFLELDCGECYKSLCSGKVDAAFVMCMERVFPECSSIRVSASPAFVLVRSTSELAQKASVAVEDLRDKRLALMSEPPFQYEPLFAQLDSLGFDRADASVISSTSTMLSMVRAYDYVGIVSEKFALDPPRGTAAVPFSDAKLFWRFYMLYRRNSSGFGSIIRTVQDVRATFEDAEGTPERSACPGCEKHAGGGGIKDSPPRGLEGAAPLEVADPAEAPEAVPSAADPAVKTSDPAPPDAASRSAAPAGGPPLASGASAACAGAPRGTIRGGA